MENMKKSKEGVVGNTKVAFKVGDGVRIAIDAIKRLKQRDAATAAAARRAQASAQL